MPNMVAFGAPDDICLLAVLGLMTDFVAFEAHFLIAIEGFMGVLAAKDAV